MLDLDHFKSINDRHGHRAGDEVLRAIAGLMTRGLRGQDHIGRYGGEEFAVLLPETSLEAAREVLERIRLAIVEMRLDVEGQELSITVSVGVVAVETGEPFEDGARWPARTRLSIARRAQGETSWSPAEA